MKALGTSNSKREGGRSPRLEHPLGDGGQVRVIGVADGVLGLGESDMCEFVKILGMISPSIKFHIFWITAVRELPSPDDGKVLLW